jgi:ABC-2 type transport system permease protein
VRRLWLVASREYIENVRTKTFLIAVFMTPVMFGLSLFVPTLLGMVTPAPRTIAIVDTTGRLGPAVAKDLATPGGEDKHPDPPYRVELVDLGAGATPALEASAQEKAAALDERVKRGELFAWVRIRPSAFTKDGASTEYRTGNFVDVDVQDHVRAAVRNAADAILIHERGVPLDAAMLLKKKLPFDAMSVLAQTKAGSAAATGTPIFFALLLFLTIVAMSQALVTTTIEEKSSRVVEVLLSSVSPFDLMGGKILGTCLVGLTLMTIWTSGIIGALAANGMLSLVDGRLLFLCFLYYLLGFGLIASLMVAVGSACNSLKEAQNLISPLMVVLTMPLFFWIVVARDPNGPLATALSFVPFFTPFWMMLRISGATPPPAWQVPASLAVLALATWLAVRFAARVFRVGVLLYGKPPSIREIFRWMRVKG